jgi:hypothetical protein
MKKTLVMLAVAAGTLAACKSATEPAPPSETVVLKEDFEGVKFPPAGWTMTDPNRNPYFRGYRNAENGNHFATLEIKPPLPYAEGFLVSPAFASREGCRVRASFRYKEGMDEEDDYSYAKMYRKGEGGTEKHDLPYEVIWRTVVLFFDYGGPADIFLLFGVVAAEDDGIRLDIDDVKVEVELMER